MKKQLPKCESVTPACEKLLRTNVKLCFHFYI